MNAIDAILNGAELDPARQAYIAAHFKPSPVPLSARLGEVERAQQDFADLREILANVLPYREWLRTRPEGLKGRDYREYVGGVKDLLAELREEFGISLLVAKPTLVEQRQRPH